MALILEVSSIFSLDSIKLPPHITISCTAKSVSTGQQNGTLYLILTEEALPGNEDVVLVEFVVREKSAGKFQ